MKSFAPEVLVDGKWAGNGLRFATREEAERWGHDRLMRWFVPTDSRAVESDERPNYRLGEDGSTTALCNACDEPSRPGGDLCVGHQRMAVGDPTAEYAPND